MPLVRNTIPCDRILAALRTLSHPTAEQVYDRVMAVCPLRRKTVTAIRWRRSISSVRASALYVYKF